MHPSDLQERLVDDLESPPDVAAACAFAARAVRDALGRRLHELGGPPPESSSELFRLGGDEVGPVLLLERPGDLARVCERLLEAVRSVGSTVSVGAGRDTARVRP